jgi:outer membrane usher protein
MQNSICKSPSILVGWSVLTLLLLFPLQSQAAEKVIMKVFLNTEDKGECIFILTTEQVVLFPLKDLLDMGFKNPPKETEVEVERERYISLNKLSGVSVEINEKESTLHITAEPKLLKKHRIDLAYKGPKEVFHTKANIAFLNYYFDYLMGDNLDFKSFSLPLEAGMSVYGYSGYSTFLYTKTDTDEKFVRLITSITKDDPRRLRRYILGDFSASSGDLGGGGNFGGLSISKNFSMSPYFIKFPGLAVSGVLKTLSDVEVYVNNLLIKSERLPPGEFELLNLPGAIGVGDTTIVIKDIYGRVEKVVTPFYLSSTLLKPGLHEYSYNIGFKREDFGHESFKYGGLAFVGFHRLGLTEAFTAGLGAEADNKTLNIAPSATFLLGKAGEIYTSAAFSNCSGRTGYGAFLSYIYAGRSISGRFFVRGHSREYANLSISTSQDKPRFEWLVGLGYNQKSFGSISATLSSTDNYISTDVKRISLFYSRRLIGEVSLYVTASRTKSDEVVDAVFVGLNFLLGKNRSGSLSYSTQDGEAKETAGIQQNPPLGTGFGYRFLAERTETSQGDKELGGNAFLQYRGPNGIYSVNYRRIAGENSYDLSIAGGVVFINGSLYLTRPVTDSFALVKVDELNNVRVYYSNEEVGVTNKRGELVVPNLISYYDNNVSIEDKDIPVNYEIPELRKYASIPYRGGGIVKFEVKKLQGFIGHLFFIEKGKKIPAEYAGLEIRVDNKVIEAVVGKEGEFYLENLPSGRFPARLFLREKECQFELTIPKSDEMLVEIGEVTCEMY